MGLDILTQRLQEIRKNQTAANQVGWLLNIANVVCLDEFLKLLNRIGLVAEFKTVLLGLIATASAAVGILNVLIAQVETAIAVEQAFVDAFKATARAALSKVGLFPFSDPNYLQCPPIQAIKQYLTSSLPVPNNPATKVYKQVTQAFKESEYAVFRLQKQLAAYQLQVSQLQTQILAWQAIVDAITSQFGV